MMALIRTCQSTLEQQRTGQRTLPLFAVILLCSLLSTSAECSEANLVEFPDLVTNGGYLVKSKSKTIGYRQKDLFLPASTLKILTSLVALDTLGPQFRFETHVFLDKKQNLYLKGYGDPFLTSEEVLKICLSLKKQSVVEIQTLFLDESFFALQQQTPGSNNSNNPYDAPNGALAVNFNTLSIHKRQNGVVQSAEPQTPTLPMMGQVAKNLPPGPQRINIKTSQTHNGISTSLQYVGELFCALLKQNGITVTKGYRKKEVPHSLPPLLVHQNSKSLQQMMGECLHYSNNFIANQVYLYMGAQDKGQPATWNKGRIFMANYLTHYLRLSPRQIIVDDGSGLSRKNKISAEAAITILEKFKPYSNLLNKKSGALIKSGTLQDVYCYGGYLLKDNSLIPFTLLLNQKNNTRDKLLKRILEYYKSNE